MPVSMTFWTFAFRARSSTAGKSDSWYCLPRYIPANSFAVAVTATYAIISVHNLDCVESSFSEKPTSANLVSDLAFDGAAFRKYWRRPSPMACSTFTEALGDRCTRMVGFGIVGEVLDSIMGGSARERPTQWIPRYGMQIFFVPQDNHLQRFFNWSVRAEDLNEYIYQLLWLVFINITNIHRATAQQSSMV